MYRLIKSEEIEKIDSVLSGCGSPAQSSWSVERGESIYSYKKLLGMNDTYHTNYTLLKQKINFPRTSDFSILITSPEENITMLRNIPPGIRVRARTLPVEILKNDDKIKAFMTLIVW